VAALAGATAAAAVDGLALEADGGRAAGTDGLEVITTTPPRIHDHIFSPLLDDDSLVVLWFSCEANHVGHSSLVSHVLMYLPQAVHLMA
jgi:hypothetical protein